MGRHLVMYYQNLQLQKNEQPPALPSVAMLEAWIAAQEKACNGDYSAFSYSED
ncbi:hypothetical protein GF380_04365 [Candidatus Uhrbacteria bacterium]|nr:hypothetical protein [Candidatus Uhrbacteria bacterium]